VNYDELRHACMQMRENATLFLSHFGLRFTTTLNQLHKVSWFVNWYWEVCDIDSFSSYRDVTVIARNVTRNY